PSRRTHPGGASQVNRCRGCRTDAGGYDQRSRVTTLLTRRIAVKRGPSGPLFLSLIDAQQAQAGKALFAVSAAVEAGCSAARMPALRAKVSKARRAASGSPVPMLASLQRASARECAGPREPLHSDSNWHACQGVSTS